MKVVDTFEYVSVLRELVEEGKEVSMLIAGGSMTPFLANQRDSISFSKPKEPLKRGDMVFYQRLSGQFVMHRIWKVKEDGYYIVGDAQTQIEGPVKREQIFAIVTKVKRKGQWIGPENFCWKFFAGPWLYLRPMRWTIMKIYGMIQPMLKKLRIVK